MQRGKPSKFKWFVRVAVLGVVVWFVWSLVGFHVSEPRGPISASKAESMLDIRLPPEAKNIRAATYSQWIEYAQYLRFEAPVDVCLRYAATVVPNAATQPADQYDLAGNARPPRA